MKLFWPLVATLLCLMCAVQVISVREESQTWDEAMHLAAGYSYWRTGDYRMNAEHPPLGKYLNSLPLLWLNPSLPIDHPSWKSGNEFAFGPQFLYHNRVDAETLLFAGRMVTIAITLLFGACLAFWTRRHFGPQTAVFALAFFVLDPNLIAHGRYVTSDVLFALLFFIAAVSWSEYIMTQSWKWLVASGVALGLALSSKFSGVILFPLFAILYIAGLFYKRPQRIALHALRSFGLVALISYVTVAAMYPPQFAAFIPGIRLMNSSVPPARLTIRTVSAAGDWLKWVCNHLGLGHNAFFDGLSMVAEHNAAGHPAYLLGRISPAGWWYYFPVVLLVKSTTGFLIGLALSVGLVAARLRNTLGRGVRFVWFALAIPAVVYFAFCLIGRIDIGVRHLLPFYPFAFILIAATLRSASNRKLLAVLVFLAAVECAWVYPYYLAFFNLPSGGPRAGYRYLLDSNLDWGQDLKRLKTYLTRQGERGACLGYFGGADARYYEIEEKDLPTTQETQRGSQLDCLVAISVTPLMGLYVDDSWSWLRAHRPIAKIGYSIYVYDFRRRSERVPVQ